MSAHPISSGNHLTKDGLTGSSGLGADTPLGLVFHVAANYAAGTATRGRSAGQPQCFVEWYGRGNPVPTWRRMTVKRAVKEERAIISCSMCTEPAVSLDHYWPYYSDGNYCAKHREAVRNRFNRDE